MAQPSRASTTRVATQRALHSRSEFRGKLHIDPARVPKDKTYIWVRETVLGAPDHENVSERMRDGWAPVPLDRHPEFMPPVLEGHIRSPYIRRGGQILMELDRDEYNLRQDDLRQENAEIVASVDRDRQASADKNFPALQPDLERKVERNGRFED